MTEQVRLYYMAAIGFLCAILPGYILSISYRRLHGNENRFVNFVFWYYPALIFLTILITLFACTGTHKPMIHTQESKVLLKDSTTVDTTHFITTVDNVLFTVKIEDFDQNTNLWLLEMQDNFDGQTIFKQSIPIDQTSQIQTFQTPDTFQIPRDTTGYFDITSTIIDEDKNQATHTMTVEVFCNRREQLDPDLKCPMTYSDIAIKYWEKGLPPFN